MKQVTIDDVIKLRPCDKYPPCRLAELADGRPYVTPTEIATLDIPAGDRLWVLTRLMTPEQREQYARRVASDVLPLWDAPEVVKQWLATGDPALREAAEAAARAARAGRAARAARAAEAAEAAARAAARAARAAEAAEAASWAAEAAAEAASWAAEAAARRATWAAEAAARRATWEVTYNNQLEVYISWAAEEVEK